MSPLSTEIYWLIVTTVFTSLLWMPHIMERMLVMKPYAALRDPRHDDVPQAPWAHRAVRAHANAFDNLIVFAALVLSLEITGGNTATTALVAKTYFVARAAHFVVYTLAVPWLRTPMFLVGLGCQLVIAATLLTG